MSTTTIYTNFHGERISPSQLNLLEEYCKETYIDGILKKVEYLELEDSNSNVREEILQGGKYYLSSGENLQDIIDEYICDGKEWLFFHNQITNDFGDVYWECKTYKNGIIDRDDRIVYNEDNQTIAHCDISETGVRRDKSKFFYGDPAIHLVEYPNEPFLIIEYFDDDDDEMEGEILRITLQGNTSFYSVSSFLNAFSTIDINFVWEDHPYLHSFDPMLPENLNV